MKCVSHRNFRYAGFRREFFSANADQIFDMLVPMLRLKDIKYLDGEWNDKGREYKNFNDTKRSNKSRKLNNRRRTRKALQKLGLR